MRIPLILNLFAISGADIINARQRSELLRELLNPVPQIMAFAGIAFAALVGALDGRIGSSVAAVVVTGVLLAARFIVSRVFDRSSEDPRWIYGFVASTLTTALGWGIAGFLLFRGPDAETKIAVLAALCAIVQGVAARAYSMPGAALGNIAVVLSGVAGAAIFEGWYFMVPGCALYLVFLFSFINLMVKLRLRQLRAERATEDLVTEIQEKNALLNEANARLAVSAMHDSLTGLGNRRLFDKTLAEESRRVGGDLSCLSLMLIDVDHFKRFNDTYGHQAGDQCLQLVAETLVGCIPKQAGLVARYGGEEFAVILPNKGLAEARIAAEEIRLAVHLKDMNAIAGSPTRQSVSIGVSVLAANSGTTPAALLTMADEALYEAKRQGRNSVRAFSADDNRREHVS